MGGSGLAADDGADGWKYCENGGGVGGRSDRDARRR